MSFLKRLYFFLFGLSIGIIILIFITNKKDTRFNYLPNKRVLNDIHKKTLVFKDSTDLITKASFLEKFNIKQALCQIDTVFQSLPSILLNVRFRTGSKSNLSESPRRFILNIIIYSSINRKYFRTRSKY